jgi:hypothetical protein
MADGAAGARQDGKPLRRGRKNPHDLARHVACLDGLVIRRVSQAAASGFFVLAAGVAALGSGSLGCGAAGEQQGGLPLVTIAECEQMDGTPLFDPEDERPLESSCPDSLEAIAELDEDFYGSPGGICCTNPDTEGASSETGVDIR